MNAIPKTEERNPRTTHIDEMTVGEIVGIMTDENLNAVKAVKAAEKEIAEAVDLISKSFAKGGRFFLVGAGTSGRLGVLDAAECPPTFGVPYDKVVGIIAGGEQSMFRATENAEDSAACGENDLLSRGVTENDCVVGISASGGAAYVVGALSAAKDRKAATVALTCNEDTAIGKCAQVTIVTDTGAEVVTGSTRLKAGTAHKMVLNILTTASMIRSGYVYENMMINLKPSNVKLRDRMIRIVCDILNCDREHAEALLAENGWNIRNAVDRERGTEK